MELIGAYLLGIHPTTAEAARNTEFITPADRDVSIYFPGGLLWGAFMLTEFSSGLPEFWKERIEHFYLKYSPDITGPYTLKLSIAQLKPRTLLELAYLKTEFPQRINELYGAVFPPSLSPRHSGGHAYPSILFCQPGPGEFSRPAQEIASDAIALMGFESCAVLSAQLENALFAAGPYSAWEYESVGAFALQEPPLGKHIGIPRVVYDFLRYQGLIFILEDLHARAARLPFVHKTVAEYLSSFTATRRRPQSYSRRFLTFLKDWETASMELKAVEDLLRVVEAEATRNSFAAVLSTSAAFRVRMPPLIRGSVIDIVAGEYRSVGGQVTNDLAIGADRQKSIGDYLRDAANSEATLANLRLQRLVIVLTILTVLVAAMALIPSLLTEEQKKTIWYGKPKEVPALPQHNPPAAPPASPK